MMKFSRLFLFLDSIYESDSHYAAFIVDLEDPRTLGGGTQGEKKLTPPPLVTLFVLVLLLNE